MTIRTGAPDTPITTQAATLLAGGLRIAAWLDRWAAPLVTLAVRLALAPIFLRSALQKLSDWSGTVYLFQYEYKVPVIPPGLAATLAAATELTMPILLILGLCTRLAAVPLLGLTMVIQFVVAAQSPAYDNPQHYLWMLLLLVLVSRGGGALSLDRLIVARFAPGRQRGFISGVSS